MNYKIMDSSTFLNEVCSSLKPTTNQYALKKRLLNIVNGLGFSDIDISLVPSENEFDFLISSLPQEIHETYIGDKLYKNDIIFDFLKSSTIPIFDANAYQYFIDSPYISTPKLQTYQQPKKLLESFGFHNSYTIPIYNKKTNMKFLFSVMHKSVNEDTFYKQVTKNIRLRLNELARATVDILLFPGFLQRLSKSTHSAPALSKREMEILSSLTKHALTQSQVAILLGISQRTVEVHLSNIKRKLGTATLATTVYTATNLGLIA